MSDGTGSASWGQITWGGAERSPRAKFTAAELRERRTKEQSPGQTEEAVKDRKK
jgi:hypothetical protein